MVTCGYRSVKPDGTVLQTTLVSSPHSGPNMDFWHIVENKSESPFLQKQIISIYLLALQWLLTAIVIRGASYEAGGVLSLAMTTSSSFSAISLFSMRNDFSKENP